MNHLDVCLLRKPFSCCCHGITHDLGALNVLFCHRIHNILMKSSIGYGCRFIKYLFWVPVVYSYLIMLDIQNLVLRQEKYFISMLFKRKGVTRTGRMSLWDQHRENIRFNSIQDFAVESCLFRKRNGKRRNNHHGRCPRRICPPLNQEAGSRAVWFRIQNWDYASMKCFMLFCSLQEVNQL